MYEIAKGWRNTAEGKRLKAAQVAWNGLYLELVRYSLYRGLLEQIRTASKELDDAEIAFDTLTGEPKPLGLTKTVIDRVRNDFPRQNRTIARKMLEEKCCFQLLRDHVVDARSMESTQLAVLKLAQCYVAKLSTMIEAAKSDWKDVHMTAYHMDHPLDFDP